MSQLGPHCLGLGKSQHLLHKFHFFADHSVVFSVVFTFVLPQAILIPLMLDNFHPLVKTCARAILYGVSALVRKHCDKPIKPRNSLLFLQWGFEYRTTQLFKQFKVKPVRLLNGVQKWHPKCPDLGGFVDIIDTKEIQDCTNRDYIKNNTVGI